MQLGQHASLSTACTVATFQQTRDIDPMLKQCWATVYDAGPTLVWGISVSVISPVRCVGSQGAHCSGNGQGYPRVRYFSNNIFTTLF